MNTQRIFAYLAKHDPEMASAYASTLEQPMSDNNSLIPQHVRLAMGEDIGAGTLPNPFKQVSNVDVSDGKKGCMSDSKRNGAQEQDISPGPQKFGRYQE